MLAAIENRRRLPRPRILTPALRVAFQSHIGCGRHTNEDAALTPPAGLGGDRGGRLMAVADGMGGQKGGGFASRYACSGLADYYHDLPGRCSQSKPVELSRRLTDRVYRIDRGLRFVAHKTRTLRDMGTTLSCLLLTATHSIIAHVGDSRIYRWRSGHLSCLTMDHTFVQEMITEGEIDPAEAGTHPLRHLLTQAVGTAEPLEHVYARIDPVKSDDRFLLCTDGLYNAVPEGRIAALLAAEDDEGTMAQALIDQALANRAGDNVTVLVALLTAVDASGLANAN
jgi:PPM family protein phosphatase